ncbi:MAG TPA: hypothetical protein VI912_02155, partial [Candidatus Bilamarchaeaceae archaeon]|nr:hypothetical protein [Candidatus Bilamarchaeaceae archaeon]
MASGPQLVPPGTVVGETAKSQHPVLEKAGALTDLVFGKVQKVIGRDPELRAYMDLAERYVREFAEKGFGSMARRLSDADRKYLGQLLAGLPESFRDGIIAKLEQAHPRLTYEEGAAVLRAVYGSENIASAEKQTVNRFLTFLENSKLVEGLFKTEQGMHTLVGLGLLEVKIPESAIKIEGIVGAKFLTAITVTRGTAFLAKLHALGLPAEKYADFVDEFIKTNNDPRKIEELVAKYFTSGEPSKVENAMKGLADSLIISEEASVIQEDLRKLMAELDSARVDAATRSRVQKAFDDLIRRRPKSDVGGRFEAYRTAVGEAIEEARRILKPKGVLNVQVEEAKKVLDLLTRYKTSAACASLLEQFGITAEMVERLVKSAEAKALKEVVSDPEARTIGRALKWVFTNTGFSKGMWAKLKSSSFGKGFGLRKRTAVGVLALALVGAGAVYAYSYYLGERAEMRQKQVTYEQNRRAELDELFRDSNVILFRSALSEPDRKFIEEVHPELAITLYRRLEAQQKLEGSFDGNEVAGLVAAYRNDVNMRDNTISAIRTNLTEAAKGGERAAKAEQDKKERERREAQDPMNRLDKLIKPLLPNEEKQRLERVEEVRERLQAQGYQFVEGKEAEAEKFLYKNLGQGNFVDTFIPGAEKNKLIEKIPEPEITELDDGQEKSVSDFEQIANIVIPQDRRVEFFN